MGTSVSLIAAAAVALSVLSGFIAFAGWPGVERPSAASPLTLAAGAADGPAAAGAARSRPILLGAPPAPAGSPGAQALELQARRDRRRSGDAFVAPAGDDAAFSAGGQRDSGRTPRPADGRSISGPVRDLLLAGAGITRTVTQAAGQAVSPISPAAEQASGNVEGLLRDLGERVGDAAAGALGAAAEG